MAGGSRRFFLKTRSTVTGLNSQYNHLGEVNKGPAQSLSPFIEAALLQANGCRFGTADVFCHQFIFSGYDIKMLIGRKLMQV